MAFPQSNLVSSAVIIENSIEMIGGLRTFTPYHCRNNDKDTELYVVDQRLDTVASDALHECKLLKRLTFPKNNIKTLAQDTFKNNQQLESLSLVCNRLTHLSTELLKPLKSLKHLYLSGNPLQTIQPVLESQLRLLLTLQVFSINLFENEFDLTQIREKLPNLKYLGVYYNFLSCEFIDNLNPKLKEKRLRFENVSEICETGGNKICYEEFEIAQKRVELGFPSLVEKVDEQRIKELEAKVTTMEKKCQQWSSELSTANDLTGKKLQELDNKILTVENLCEARVLNYSQTIYSNEKNCLQVSEELQAMQIQFRSELTQTNEQIATGFNAYNENKRKILELSGSNQKIVKAFEDKFLKLSSSCDELTLNLSKTNELIVEDAKVMKKYERHISELFKEENLIINRLQDVEKKLQTTTKTFNLQLVKDLINKEVQGVKDQLLAVNNQFLTLAQMIGSNEKNSRELQARRRQSDLIASNFVKVEDIQAERLQDKEGASLLTKYQEFLPVIVHLSIVFNLVLIFIVVTVFIYKKN